MERDSTALITGSQNYNDKRVRAQIISRLTWIESVKSVDPF